MRRKVHDLAKVLDYTSGLLRATVRLTLFANTHGRRAIFIGRSPRIVNRGKINIGTHFRTRSFTNRVLIETGRRGTIEIGDEVFVNQGTCVFAEHTVRIGNRVDIGDGVRIYDTNFHPTRPGETTKTAPVVIEDDVWLASGSTVLPGVTIGRGSVVGVGAVVTKSVPQGSVVAGQPARVVESFDVPPGYRRRTVA